MRALLSFLVAAPLVLLFACSPSPTLSDDDDDSAGDDDDDDSVSAACSGLDGLVEGQMSGAIDGAAWLDQGGTWLSNEAAGTVQIQSTRVDDVQITLMVRQGGGQSILDLMASEAYPIQVTLGDLAVDDGSAVARIGGVSHTAEDGGGGLLHIVGAESGVLTGCFTAEVAVPGGSVSVGIQDIGFRVPLL